MMTLEDCRAFYAQEIRFAASLTTPGLVEAFARVPREKFLGPAPWLIGSATARALSLAGIGLLKRCANCTGRHSLLRGTCESLFRWLFGLRS